MPAVLTSRAKDKAYPGTTRRIDESPGVLALISLRCKYRVGRAFLRRRHPIVIARTSARGLEQLFSDKNQVKELLVILKGDVQGSVEAARDNLNKLSTERVKIRIIRSGVGAITESDVMLAAASANDMNRASVIIGFNVKPETRAREIAEAERVDIRLHTVIYKIEEEIRKAMLGLLDATKHEVITGHAEVRQVFRVPKVGQIAGSYVTDGSFKRTTARILRDNVVIFEGKIESLRRFKDDVGEVKQGFECGISLERFQDIKMGDVIEAYTTEEVPPPTFDPRSRTQKESGLKLPTLSDVWERNDRITPFGTKESPEHQLHRVSAQ